MRALRREPELRDVPLAVLRAAWRALEEAGDIVRPAAALLAIPQ